MQKNIIKFAFISGITFSLFCLANAAVIPKGTKLSKTQVLNKDNSSEPSTLDPSLAYENLGANIIRDLFEGLVTISPSGNIAPGVASSWTHSKDGLTYTFKLRENAKWSDGSQVTANDFVYSFKRFVNPKTAAQQAYLAASLKNAQKIINGKMEFHTLGVKAQDNHTFQITLEEPTPYILNVLAGVNFVPLKKDIVEKDKTSWTQPSKMVSNGAYKLFSWKVSDHISLKRNANYWDNKNTVIETVNYFPVIDKTSSFRMYQAGQIDWTYGIPLAQYQKIKIDFANELKESPQLTSGYLIFNTAIAPFNNLKLRKALTFAVDKNDFVKYVTAKGEKPLYDIVPNGVHNYTPYIPEWAKLSKKERLEKAQKLYNEAGYSQSKPLKIKFSYSTNETTRKYVTALASIWEKALGVKSELENQEWKVYLSTIQNKNFQVTNTLWSADYDDAQNFLALLESSNLQNNGSYNNKKFDELLKTSSKELNSDKRKQILLECAKIAMEEYPILPSILTLLQGSLSLMFKV